MAKVCFFSGWFIIIEQLCYLLINSIELIGVKLRSLFGDQGIISEIIFPVFVDQAVDLVVDMVGVRTCLTVCHRAPSCVTVLYFQAS